MPKRQHAIGYEHSRASFPRPVAGTSAGIATTWSWSIANYYLLVGRYWRFQWTESAIYPDMALASLILLPAQSPLGSRQHDRIRVRGNVTMIQGGTWRVTGMNCATC